MHNKEARLDVGRWGSPPEPADAVSVASTSSPGDFTVTVNRQPFPVIFLNCSVSDGSDTQVGIALGLQCQFLACVDISGWKVGYSERKEGTMLGQK